MLNSFFSFRVVELRLKLLQLWEILKRLLLLFEGLEPHKKAKSTDLVVDLIKMFILGNTIFRLHTFIACHLCFSSYHLQKLRHQS